MTELNLKATVKQSFRALYSDSAYLLCIGWPAILGALLAGAFAASIPPEIPGLPSTTKPETFAIVLGSQILAGWLVIVTFCCPHLRVYR